MVIIGPKVSSTKDDALIALTVQEAMLVSTVQGAVIVWTFEGAEAIPMLSGAEVASTVAETRTSTEKSSDRPADGRGIGTASTVESAEVPPMALGTLGEICSSCSLWIVVLLVLRAFGPELDLEDVVLRKKHMMVPRNWKLKKRSFCLRCQGDLKMVMYISLLMDHDRHHRLLDCN